MNIISMTETGLRVETSEHQIKEIPYHELGPNHEALKNASKSAIWYLGVRVGYEAARRK